jgi:hypothetical protein
MVPLQQPYNMFAQQKQQNKQQEQAQQQQMAVPAQPAQPVVEQPSMPVPTINPTDPASGVNALASMYTSPEKEEQLRRSSMANRRIMAVGDALRHIGNIVNTVKYAPSQQFNSPVMEEEARYEKGKAVRDAANMKYNAYQQAKAEQDAKQRQWEAQMQIQAANAASQHAYRQEQARIAAERAANQKAHNEAMLGLNRDRLAEQVANNKANREQRAAYQKGQLALGAQRVGIARQNASNQQAYRNWKMKGGGGSGSGVAPLDTPKGRITPNGKSYNNQLLQMFDYAKSRGLVKESDVSKRLREMGFGKDQSDNVKRQMVMDLLRTNQSMGDYASNRLGWSYSGGAVNSAPSIGWDDDDDNDDNGELEIGW